MVTQILALDPATKCGWAHSSGASGTWDLSVRRDESDGMRLIRLQCKLGEIHKSAGIDLLVFEAARNMKFGNAIRVAGEIQGAIKLWCENHDVPYRAYSATEIKKFATGKGSADKGKMLAAAHQKWPLMSFVDDNHVDALWVLEFAKHEFSVLAA